MNREHNIKDLDLLYADAKKLANEVVLEKIDGDILKRINTAINNLREYWRGQDATVQINNLIAVENLVIDNRDIAGNVGVYISMLAKNYRDAQNANAMLLPSFLQLDYKKIVKVQKTSDDSSETYMNNNITNVTNAISSIINSVEQLNTLIENIKNSILNNWVQEDENRDYALKLFEKFSENSILISKGLNEVVRCINTAIDNYNFTVATISTAPSLESMFNKEDTIVEQEYTEEEKEMLGHIQKNFQNNKRITDEFNNRLAAELEKEVSKGAVK